MNNMQKGKITQIIGPVVDVYFPAQGGSASGGEGSLPALRNALLTEVPSSAKASAGKEGRKIILEVAQHVGLGRVRAIALQDTSGLARGAEVTDTGGPGSLPVGGKVRGRFFNVIGETIDGKEALGNDIQKLSIHRDAPPFKEQRTKAEVFETGIKAVDLLAPFIKGGKVGLFGGAGVGKTVLIQEL